MVNKRGFLVHGNWTGNNKNQVSFGNTKPKNFGTVKKAKEYLKKNNVKEYVYVNSYGKRSLMKF